MTDSVKKKRLAVLVSGGGSNMAAIMESIDRGEINGEICVVISSNAEAYALTRATARGIPAYVCAKKDFASAEARDREILRLLDEYHVDYVLLAGYLGILSSFVIEAYAYKIVNVHPALLPKFGGKGYFGIHVHEAVLAAHEKVSGATVHFVHFETDTGPIIAQRSVEVREDDTPQTLADRVLTHAEHILFPETVRKLCNDEIRVENGKVIEEEK